MYQISTVAWQVCRKLLIRVGLFDIGVYRCPQPQKLWQMAVLLPYMDMDT